MIHRLISHLPWYPIGVCLVMLFLIITLALWRDGFLPFPVLTQLSQRERLVAEVSQKLDFSGEQPDVATVTNVSKLGDQPLFQNAQNGDKLLLYRVAQRAVLYRPKIGKIINMDVAVANGDGIVPVFSDIGEASAFTEMNDTVPAIHASLSIYNGTREIVFMDGYISHLREKLPGVDIVSVENAANRAYDTSILVVMPEVDASVAAVVTKTLGLPVGNLPEAEASPASDFLIIVGKDKK